MTDLYDLFAVLVAKAKVAPITLVFDKVAELGCARIFVDPAFPSESQSRLLREQEQPTGWSHASAAVR